MRLSSAKSASASGSRKRPTPVHRSALPAATLFDTPPSPGGRPGAAAPHLSLPKSRL